MTTGCDIKLWKDSLPSQSIPLPQSSHSHLYLSPSLLSLLPLNCSPSQWIQERIPSSLLPSSCFLYYIPPLTPLTPSCYSPTHLSPFSDCIHPLVLLLPPSSCSPSLLPPLCSDYLHPLASLPLLSILLLPFPFAPSSCFPSPLLHPPASLPLLSILLLPFPFSPSSCFPSPSLHPPASLSLHSILVLRCLFAPSCCSPSFYHYSTLSSLSPTPSFVLSSWFPPNLTLSLLFLPSSLSLPLTRQAFLPLRYLFSNVAVVKEGFGSRVSWEFVKSDI